MKIKELLSVIMLLFFVGCGAMQPEESAPLIVPDVKTPEANLDVPTPTLAVSAETIPMILQFGFLESPTKPSDAAQLEWDVQGVEEVTITRTGGQWGEAGQQWVVPATGSMTQTFSDSLGGSEIMYRLEAVEGVSAEFPVNLSCEHEWVFEHIDPVCPAAARESNGMQQNFENGLMLWIEAQNIVLFTTWNGQTHGVYDNTFNPNSDLARAEGVTPPDGYFQPENEFGKVWRDNDDVRAALGWAIGSPIGFSVVRQSEIATRTGVIEEYITLHDGTWIFIDQSVLVWDVTYPAPKTVWVGERPPVTFNPIENLAVATIPPTPVPVEPTAVVIVQPTATTPPVATAMPQPTATSVPTVAPVVPQATLTSEPTPIIIVPTATPVEGTADGITVHQFDFEREPTRPSDTVLLQWNISGVSSIHVERAGGEWGEADTSYDLPAQGSLEQTFDPEVGGWPVIYVVTSDDDPNFEYQISTVLPCEWEWLFDFPYEGGGCPEKGIISNGSMQTFERGFMIWVESLDTILYSTWDGLSNGRITDNFVNDVDPIKDESIVAPAGLYQPEYGFGKAWREQPGLRDLLGWGNDWSRGYTVLMQSEPFSRYGVTEYILMNGGLITIENPDPIWRIEYPR